MHSVRRVREFQLADADALNRKKNHIIIVFKEKLEANQMIPEILTYRTMRLCIEFSRSLNEVAARIRYKLLLESHKIHSFSLAYEVKNIFSK